MNLWKVMKEVELTKEIKEEIERYCTMRKREYAIENEIVIREMEIYKEEKKRVLSRLNIFSQAEILRLCQ